MLSLYVFKNSLYGAISSQSEFFTRWLALCLYLSNGYSGIVWDQRLFLEWIGGLNIVLNSLMVSIGTLCCPPPPEAPSGERSSLHELQAKEELSAIALSRNCPPSQSLCNGQLTWGYKGQPPCLNARQHLEPSQPQMSPKERLRGALEANEFEFNASPCAQYYSLILT